jgi:hypothetical protein
MKMISIKCCDECPYCEIKLFGKVFDVIAICLNYDLMLINPLVGEEENIDIAEQIHPSCELNDYIGPAMAM